MGISFIIERGYISFVKKPQGLILAQKLCGDNMLPSFSFSKRKQSRGFLSYRVLSPDQLEAIGTVGYCQVPFDKMINDNIHKTLSLEKMYSAVLLSLIF